MCSIRVGCHSPGICKLCSTLRRWFYLSDGDILEQIAAPQKEVLEGSLFRAWYFLSKLLDLVPACLVVCSGSWVAGSLLQKSFLPGCCSLAVSVGKLVYSKTLGGAAFFFKMLS